MIEKIDLTGMVHTPSCEDISSWVAQVVWGMDGKPLMRNAWRTTGYNWFAKEGNMAGGGGVVDISDDDDMDDRESNMDDDNFDVDSDILADVLGAGDKSDDDYDEDGMM
jgi:hypothetical protein